MHSDNAPDPLLPELPPFSEENFAAGYRKIRKKLHRYDSVPLIIEVARYINSGADVTDALRRLPWLGMLLIKWVLVDSEFNKPGRRRPEPALAGHLVQEMNRLAIKTRMPDDYDHFLLFMRAMAQQQFAYQRSFSPASFHRQTLLFGGLAPEHPLRRRFAESTGLELPEFIELGVALLMRVITKPREPVVPHWFATVKIPDAEAKARLLLAAVGAAPRELRARLLAAGGERRSAREYYEFTALAEKPFLELQGRYWAWYPALVHRRMEHFVHDQLRALGAQEFMQSFGSLFERHVGTLIARTSLPTTTEPELIRLRTDHGSPVDFVITEGDAHILVEAKGIVDSNAVMTTHRSEIVRNGLEKTALKAVGQGVSVATWLRTATGLPAKLAPRPRTYLLVVTYKELYLGSGPTFRDMAAKADLDELYRAAGERPALPLENVRFMSVEDFDLLCRAVATSRISFAQALDQARATDVDPLSRKFEFRQHLRAWPFYEKLRKELEASFMRLLEDYAAKYGAHHQAGGSP